MGATLSPHLETLVRIARAAGEVVMRHYEAGVRCADEIRPLAGDRCR